MKRAAPVHQALFQAITLGLAIILVVGCGSRVENDLQSQRGDDSSNDAGATSGSSGAGGAGGSDHREGDYLLVVSAVLVPSKPIVFLSARSYGAGGTFSMTLTALAAADRKTPVGDAFLVGPFAIESDGTFHATLPTMDIPGEANPISGSKLTGVSAVLDAVQASPIECGLLSGSIATPPVLLNGSTFTLLPIPTTGAWPTIVINCEGTEAEPLPGG